MGKVRLFKTPEYSVKQPPDPVVCKPPANGILCAPSASGKTVLLVSMILEQYRGCFERIFVFSPSVEVDSAWQPVKDYIRDELGVNTDREQCWWEDWDEGALRKIIADQKRITQRARSWDSRSSTLFWWSWTTTPIISPCTARREMASWTPSSSEADISTKFLDKHPEIAAHELGRVVR